MGYRLSVRRIAGAVLLTLACLANAAPAESVWQIASVVSVTDLVVPPAIAFDAWNRAQVVYGTDLEELQHVRAAGTGALPGWAPPRGTGISLPYVSGGQVYLATSTELLYCGFRPWYSRLGPYVTGDIRVFNGTTWGPSITSGTIHSPCGVVRDASRQLHWVMHMPVTENGPLGYYLYARVDDADTYLPMVPEAPGRAQLDWDETVLAQGGEATIDAAGEIHFIQFLETGGGTLLYAHGPVDGPFEVDPDLGAGWQVKLGRPGIAVDPSGNVHVVYTEEWPSYGIKYLTRSGEEWTSEYIETGGNVVGCIGTFPEVVIDWAGRVHVFYADLYSGLLKHAVKYAGAWQIESIDTIALPVMQWNSGAAPGALAAAVDKTGGIGVVYYDADDWMLKYAYTVPPPAALVLEPGVELP